MNVFTCLYNFSTKGATRINFHLFNFFTHLLILGITNNFTTKGILIAYASFIINFFCGEFLFFRINKVLKGLERLIYANQHLEDLEEQEEHNSEDQEAEQDHNSEEQTETKSSKLVQDEQTETKSSKLVQDEQETMTDKEFSDYAKDKILLDVSSEESEDEQQSTLRERICSEINF